MTRLTAVTAMINAERIKLTTVRSPLWSTVAAAALSFGIAALQAATAYDYEQLTAPTAALGVAVFGVPVLMIVAAMTVTGEYRTGMVRTTFMASPSRTLVLVTKAVVAAVFSGVAAVIMVIGSVLVARADMSAAVWRTTGAFALAVYQEFGAPADAVVIGHDWGAFTSNAIAAHPDSPFAEHISLAMPPVAALSRTRGPVGRQLRMMPQQVRNSWYILFFQLPVLPERLLPRIIPRLWSDWGPPGFPTGAALDDALAALASPAHRRAAVGYYRALVRPQRPAPLYTELNGWRFEVPRVPILHLQGAQDGAMMAGYADQITEVLPQGSRVLTVASAGHFLQIEQPRVVADAILAYLDSR